MTPEGLHLKMPQLNSNEVHVWELEIALFKGDLERLGRILNKSEWKRARKYVFEKDRIAFIVRRGVLKKLLGGYLDLKAETVDLVFDEKGKPKLGGRKDLYFNLSDSGEVVLYVITRVGEVGIDVEYMREGIEFDDIVGSYFSEDEQAKYFSLKAEKRATGFYTVWTRKEAYLKAIGEGLSKRLDQFSVSVDPNSPGSSVAGDEDWWLEDVDCPKGYRAAICTAGTGVKVAYYRVSGDVYKG